MGFLEVFDAGAFTNGSSVWSGALPVDETTTKIVYVNTGSSGSYGQHISAWLCTKDGVTQVLNSIGGRSLGFIRTGYFDSLGIMKIEKVDEDRMLAIECKSRQNELGIRGPLLSIHAYYIDPVDILQDHQNYVIPVSDFDASFTSDYAYSINTQFEWEGQYNGTSSARWDANRQTAKISENEYIAFGYASDIRTSDNVGKSNLWAVRFSTDTPVETTTTLTVPTWWKHNSTSNWRQGGDGSVTVSISSFPPRTAGTVTVTVEYHYDPVKPPTADSNYGLYNYIAGQSNVQYRNQVVTSASGTISFTVDVNEASESLHAAFWGSAASFSPSVGKDTYFYSGAPSVHLNDYQKDMAVGLYEEYIGYGSGAYSSYLAGLSEAVYEDGHLYSWAMDRNDTIVQFDVDLGSTLGISTTTHSEVPSRFKHEYARKSHVAGGGTLNSWYWANSRGERVSFDAPHRSYEINVLADVRSQTEIIDCLFGWRSPGGTNAYSWGKAGITLAPYPVASGSDTDVTVTITMYPQDVPPGVDDTWTGPYIYRRITYNTTGAWAPVSSGATTTNPFTYTMTVDNNTGIKVQLSDVTSTSSSLFSTPSSASPYAEFVFPTEATLESGPVGAWSGGAKALFYDDLYDYTYRSVWKTLRTEYPSGHPDRVLRVFGAFTCLSTTVVPWSYVVLGNLGEGPPMKMNQRDDGLGYSGGPGRIGYYGINGESAIRINNGGAW